MLVNKKDKMKIIYTLKHIVIALCFIFAFSPLALGIDKPVAIDSRIKTLIYSENEVFRVVVNYGYQTSIEFANDEEIQTISVGNNFAWQLTPIGKRLFIKPLEDNILTNMTLITNHRAYQFEIQSKNLANTLDDELVYVLRFFYPDEDVDSQRPNVVSKATSPIPVVKPFNFNYSFAGNATFMPIKVFDDGISTFFKFKDDVSTLPQFSYMLNDTKFNLEPKQRGDYIVVNKVLDELILSDSTQVINIRNDQLSKNLGGSNE